MKNQTILLTLFALLISTGSQSFAAALPTKETVKKNAWTGGLAAGTFLTGFGSLVRCLDTNAQKKAYEAFGDAAKIGEVYLRSQDYALPQLAADAYVRALWNNNRKHYLRMYVLEIPETITTQIQKAMKPMYSQNRYRALACSTYLKPLMYTGIALAATSVGIGAYQWYRARKEKSAKNF